MTGINMRVSLTTIRYLECQAIKYQARSAYASEMAQRGRQFKNYDNYGLETSAAFYATLARNYLLELIAAQSQPE